MSVSINDIALKLTSGGSNAYFRAVKGVGCLIWDLRTGLFDSSPPEAATALDFIEDTDWKGCVQRIVKPLEQPIYGTIDIDFDAKLITDANGYGASNIIAWSWLFRSVESSARGVDDFLPASSLLAHLQAGRICLLDSHSSDIFNLRAETFSEALETLSALRASTPEFARLAMPDGWALESASTDGA